MVLGKKESISSDKSRYYKFLIYLILIALFVYGLHYFGFIKKNCGANKECFYEAAKTCKPAKVLFLKDGHYYNYMIKGKRGQDCLVYIQLKKMGVGTSQELLAMFEGKDMDCRIPRKNLEQTSFAELKGFVNYCHGTLKEAIYEQIITKMYGLIIQNFESIISATPTVPSG